LPYEFNGLYIKVDVYDALGAKSTAMTPAALKIKEVDAKDRGKIDKLFNGVDAPNWFDWQTGKFPVNFTSLAMYLGRLTKEKDQSNDKLSQMYRAMSENFDAWYKEFKYRG
jgi:hypothetical protein